MNRVLTIDRGNSSTKLTLWNLETLPHMAEPLGFMRCYGFPDANELLSFAGDTPLAGVALSAVAPVDYEALARLGVEVRSVKDVEFDTLYRPSASLGADRVAAMLGAKAYGFDGRILVADLGTAATFDLLDEHGRHIGGNIAPGLGMRLKALHAMTAKLPLLEKSEPTPGGGLGLSTAQAISRGCADGLLAELNHYATQAERVFLTGRDAPLLAPLADFHATVDPHLVGRGLLSILHSK